MGGCVCGGGGRVPHIVKKLDTRITFQIEMFWLNAVAPSNILFMLLTDATFHEPIFWLNVGLL